ncbi:MAG: hypothetical protein RR645_01515 [Clostridium sp.]
MKKFVSGAIVLCIIYTTATSVYASSAYYQANSRLSHLESSFEKNYLGNKNLPTFRTYLSEAKSFTNKVTNTSDKRKLDNRIVLCEDIIVTTENVVNMENSMDKNYKGTKNLPSFISYLDKLNASLLKVKNKVVHNKLSQRSYAGANVIRDIKVVDSGSYIMAAKLRDEAISLFNAGDSKGSKSRASEALEFVWECDASLAKDAIAAELKAIRDN